MFLADASIKALKPRDVRYLVTDGRGLCLEVLPSGKLSWLYRYRFKGKPEKVMFGRYPDMSLKSARQQRDKLAIFHEKRFLSRVNTTKLTDLGGEVGACEDVKPNSTELRMHLAWRWFTGLGFDQEIPHHSTFSKNWHGRFQESRVFEHFSAKSFLHCLSNAASGRPST
jgi:hypothetical protein